MEPCPRSLLSLFALSLPLALRANWWAAGALLAACNGVWLARIEPVFDLTFPWKDLVDEEAKPGRSWRCSLSEPFARSGISLREESKRREYSSEGHLDVKSTSRPKSQQNLVFLAEISRLEDPDTQIFRFSEECWSDSPVYTVRLAVFRGIHGRRIRMNYVFSVPLHRGGTMTTIHRWRWIVLWKLQWKIYQVCLIQIVRLRNVILCQCRRKTAYMLLKASVVYSYWTAKQISDEVILWQVCSGENA